MKVALFIPCFIEELRPAAGLATARLLDRLELDWRCPEGQTCCGQPAYNAGFAGEVLPAARHFLDIFGTAEAVVSPSGSCVAMVRRYATLPGLEEDERRAFAKLGRSCFELSDFLVSQLQRIDLGARFQGRAAFQDCCHSLRELGVSEQPRQLLAAVEGLELVDQPGLDCCGFGGTYAVKMPELSVAQADARLEALEDAGTDILIATDSSCLMHLETRARRLKVPFRGLHLAEILAGDES